MDVVKRFGGHFKYCKEVCKNEAERGVQTKMEGEDCLNYSYYIAVLGALIGHKGSLLIFHLRHGCEQYYSVTKVHLVDRHRWKLRERAQMLLVMVWKHLKQTINNNK